MTPNDQKVKVETDYKMSRHFNGTVFSVVALMLIIVLVLLFLFYKGRNKVMPATPKATPRSAVNVPSLRPMQSWRTTV